LDNSSAKSIGDQERTVLRYAIKSQYFNSCAVEIGIYFNSNLVCMLPSIERDWVAKECISSTVSALN